MITIGSGIIAFLFPHMISSIETCNNWLNAYRLSIVGIFKPLHQLYTVCTLPRFKNSFISFGLIPHLSTIRWRLTPVSLRLIVGNMLHLLSLYQKRAPPSPLAIRLALYVSKISLLYTTLDVTLSPLLIFQ